MDDAMSCKVPKIKRMIPNFLMFPSFKAYKKGVVASLLLIRRYRQTPITIQQGTPTPYGGSIHYPAVDGYVGVNWRFL